MAKTYELSDVYQNGFDNEQRAALTIESGDTVIFDCPEACGGQITPESTAAVIPDLDWSRIHTIVGPVYINGSEPGDVLAVEILELIDHGWGWTGVFPGMGLLPQDFEGQSDLHIWHVGSDGRAAFKPNIRVPIEPFCGIMGLAPAEPGNHSTLPPRPTGGNMDIRHLKAGSTLYLPVTVPGGLFSVGDCHLAQGDGEVCQTAIEAPMTVALRFSLRKGWTIREPQYETSGPTISKYDGMGHFATTASGPDLYENSQNAVRYMIDLLGDRYGLSRMEAYMLCSAAGDFKICEIVDSPNWLVSFSMPRSIFIGV